MWEVEEKDGGAWRGGETKGQKEEKQRTVGVGRSEGGRRKGEGEACGD